jgi:hypothetical protein
VTKLRYPKPSGAICPRCRGQGLTLWDAILDSFANLIGALIGKQYFRPCWRCKGSGSLVK